MRDHRAIRAAIADDLLDAGRAVMDGADPADVLQRFTSSPAARRNGARGDDAREIIDWPEPPAVAAFTGLAGEIVDAIAPHTEADASALLVTLLVSFGNAAGRHAYFLTDAQKQHTNEFALLVGSTSSGRKGTAAAHVRRFLTVADPTWTREHVRSGLSSGEGVIFHVRDAAPAANGGTDEGVTDKRLLIAESEFATALKVMRREGNTLSPVVRQAWDGDTIRTLTRSSPLTATDPHISIIGHITPDELRRLLQQADAANGLVNRFLLVAVRRSKLLPEGGSVPSGDVELLGQSLGGALAFARETGAMERTEQARSLWRDDVYPKLVDRPSGLLGAATSRAAPHVVRLSLLYALLDRSRLVDVPHLEAALSLWRYVEASTRLVLGDALGDPIADRILAAMRGSTDGLTRSELNELGAGHWSTDDITSALQRLAADGLAAYERQPTGGRPREVWRFTWAGAPWSARAGASFAASQRCPAGQQPNFAA